jgi:predicted RNA binding protein YcfA (HicA-like mRNA interferase family)/predicted RNase H-like HicB family nuclease
MNFEVEFEQEDDGRWIAEIVAIPGVLVYGLTPLQAGQRARALALRVLADPDWLENETLISSINLTAFSDRYGPWASRNSQQLVGTLLKLRWSIKRQFSSHKIFEREGYPDYVFAFHDDEEVGSKMLARVFRHIQV